jgi:hypothetical protein
MSGKCNFELMQVSVTSEISEWAVGIQCLEGSTEKIWRWKSNSNCFPHMPTFFFFFFTSTLFQKFLKCQSILQCFGSVSFWCGSGSADLHPWWWIRVLTLIWIRIRIRGNFWFCDSDHVHLLKMNTLYIWNLRHVSICRWVILKLKMSSLLLYKCKH